MSALSFEPSYRQQVELAQWRVKRVEISQVDPAANTGGSLAQIRTPQSTHHLVFFFKLIFIGI